jgi:hypothetical protein
MSFFDYRRFYVLDEAFRRGALRVHALRDIPDPLALTRGEVAAQPVRFHHDAGTRAYDLVGTTWGGILLVSDRVISALEEHHFTGWRAYTVALFDSRGAAIDGYSGLAVTGRCGPVEDGLSPLMPVPPRGPGGSVVMARIGLRFVPDTWDGSDLFVPDETGLVFVTQAVRDALCAIKVTNMNFTRITEVEMVEPRGGGGRQLP